VHLLGTVHVISRERKGKLESKPKLFIAIKLYPGRGWWGAGGCGI